jgi:hypothetical protein
LMPGDETCSVDRGKFITVLGISGGAHVKTLHNFNFSYHIHVLLINASLIIYICYILHRGKAEISMLTVRDDKLNVEGTWDGGRQ